jgi:hypothetical protein
VWVYRGAGVIAAELRHTAPAAIELGEGWRAVQCGQGIAEGLGRTGLGLWSCLAGGLKGGFCSRFITRCRVLTQGWRAEG